MSSSAASVLITCPPMIATKEQYLQRFKDSGLTVYCPNVVQTMTEEELIQLVPQYDGWIIGDDPATRKVFNAGRKGRLRAAVKWGIGVDNVDFSACREFSIPVANTPDMFGDEVADIAISYVIGLARETYRIDREIREGFWPKYQGISLSDKNIGVVGYGDIGKASVKRLLASGMNVTVYDPYVTEEFGQANVNFSTWPEELNEQDFILFTCSLNDDNYHMLNKKILNNCKKGVRIINVARGPLINEQDLMNGLLSGQVLSAALDVFEVEPLPADSKLRNISSCIFGSHNSSNTFDAVARTNTRVIKKIFDFLGIKE